MNRVEPGAYAILLMLAEIAVWLSGRLPSMPAVAVEAVSFSTRSEAVTAVEVFVISQLP